MAVPGLWAEGLVYSPRFWIGGRLAVGRRDALSRTPGLPSKTAEFGVEGPLLDRSFVKGRISKPQIDRRRIRMSSLGNPSAQKVTRKRRFHDGRTLYSNYFVDSRANATALYGVAMARYSAGADLVCVRYIRHIVVSGRAAC